MSPAGGSWLAVGFLGLALAVTAGAFGAHTLGARLDARSLELWETACRYLTYGALGITASGLAAGVWPAAGWSRPALCLLAGTAIFSGTVGGLALGGPRWLGAVTPIGGTLMIVGFAWLAWVGWKAG